jgi:cobalt-precorrin 5A hydrolase
MIVAGLGFRHGATAREILDLVARALAEARMAPPDLDALATLAARAGEPGFREAAECLDLPALAAQAQDVAAAAPGVVTHSPRVAALHGIGSVAEAAALAGAGMGARLILPRIASARVTCALAKGDEPWGDEP